MPPRLGVAVSGGGDSVALLCLAREMCATQGSALFAVTVDHGLRAESTDEAQTVATLCEELGVPHEVLRWGMWDGHGNLQNAAREARYELMGDWAARHDIGTVALGHTADDQAETMLMRIARRSGVDGLCGIPARQSRHGIDWVRPLLQAKRANLRTYLTENHISWVDDPSNDDTAFDRIKARRALTELAGLGIDAEAFQAVAENMVRVRKALILQTSLAAHDLCHLGGGGVSMCARKLLALPDEIRRRLLVQAIGWITGNVYPARRDAVLGLMAALERGTGATLDGCQVTVHRGQIWIFREYQAVRHMRCSIVDTWDNRWQFRSAEPVVDKGNLELRALGEEGLGQCGDWRAVGLPRALLLGTPSVWEGDHLVAAPLANPDNKWRAELDGGEEAFFATLLSH
ncbi:tRNA lysidine(34) synthetase TilS [Sulfitobacter sp. SK012]|uniref:tRNA lysidine(34) synthetase TilS n=1 Tax=Sulfitobacter sp. SK012 TaxID=1389005 RepID=UPI0020C823C0|nr:tRNA lysidine(34) synthetase TilS [Sulfitobacter sp. SK012]